MLGTIEGTLGEDLIDATYVGDPEGEAPTSGNDVILGGADNDHIYAGAGNDTVYGGDDDDRIWGGEGDDRLFGDNGNDILNGDAGNDHLEGGAGDDTLKGDAGNDILVGGEGRDWLDGGADRDIFYAGAGDYVNGGSEGDDFDTLDLTQVGPYRIEDLVRDGNGNGWNGTVVLLGTDGQPTGETIRFQDIEEIREGNPDPRGPDGTVEGTRGDNLIDYDYTGDPEGDMVDHEDALLPGHVGNDDLIYGYGGNDTVIAGAGADTIYGGAGEDVLYGGDGNDYFNGGRDDDTYYGGAGDDYFQDSRGREVVYGGDGNDTIRIGGINGADDPKGDEMGPDDLVYGGNGDDLIHTGGGDDTVHGDADNDTVFAGSGHDTVFGGTGNDTLHGGTGNDVLQGDEGDDVIHGDKGNDTITGGAGNDSLYGGNDRDIFFGGNGGDHVDGGSGGDDWDTLDLTGVDYDRIEYTSTDREDGIVHFRDGSTMNFYDIEKVIPCFTPGTTIATPRGERLVEELKVGDRIITRDNGIQEIRWIGAKPMDARMLEAAPHLRPILIRAGALGNGLPERDMMVSPNHRMLVSNDRTQLYFEESEVLAAAKHLVGAPGIKMAAAANTTYIHFMFDRHEVVLSNGAWTESFQPGDHSLKGIGAAQRSEILELFPDLQTTAGIEAYQAARKSLKKHEARLILG